MAAAGSDRIWIETWRTFAYIVFGGLFVILAWRPQHSPGIWELVFAHKSGVVLYGLTHAKRGVQWLVAAVCVALAIAVINVGPENPYQTLPPQLLAAGPTHFLSFSGMVRALSELWPFIALLYVGTMAVKRPDAEPEAR